MRFWMPPACGLLRSIESRQLPHPSSPAGRSRTSETATPTPTPTLPLPWLSQDVLATSDRLATSSFDLEACDDCKCL